MVCSNNPLSHNYIHLFLHVEHTTALCHEGHEVKPSDDLEIPEIPSTVIIVIGKL